MLTCLWLEFSCITFLERCYDIKQGTRAWNKLFFMVRGQIMIFSSIVLIVNDSNEIE